VVVVVLVGTRDAGIVVKTVPEGKVENCRRRAACDVASQSCGRGQVGVAHVKENEPTGSHSVFQAPNLGMEPNVIFCRLLDVNTGNNNNDNRR
jgi:hypothetical protein